MLLATDFSKINALVVDDMATAREYISKQLRDIGVISILSASSIPDAFKKINDKIHLIICDHNLGEGRTGKDFIEELRKEEKIPDSVICVMVTAEDRFESVIGSSENGIDGYFLKPWKPHVFRDKIQAMVKRQELLTPIYDAIAKQQYEKALQICDEKLLDSEFFGHLKFKLKKLRTDILVRMGLFISAIAEYDAILDEKDIISPWALHGKAKSLIQLSRYEEAEIILVSLIEKSPHYMACYDNLISLYETRGDLDKQEEMLVRAIGMSGEKYHRHKKLAEVAILNKKTEVAQNMLGILHTKGRHSPHVDASSIYIHSKMLRDGGRAKEAVELLSGLKLSFRYDTDRVQSIRAIDDISQGKEISIPINLLPPEARVDYAIQCFQRGDDILAREICLSISPESVGLIGVLFADMPAALTTVIENNRDQQKSSRLDVMRGSLRDSLQKGEWDRARKDIILKLDEVKKQPDLLVMTMVFFCRYIEKSEKDMHSDRELVLVLWSLLHSISQDEKQLAVCRLVMKQIGIVV